MEPSDPGDREPYRGRVVLVTGGAGAIGSNLVRALVAAGADVTVLDDLSSGATWHWGDAPPARFVRGDVANRVALARSFEPRPAFVFHLAACFANQNSLDHPELDLSTNALGTLRLLETAAAAGVTRLVYASSSSIYGGDAPLPTPESAATFDLRTPYQATKLAGEIYCRVFAAEARLSTVSARLFNSYGPGEEPGRYRNVIPNFVHRALRGDAIPLVGGGTDTRDFTFVEDVVDGLLRCGLAAGAEGRAFNLGAGRETRIRDLVAEILARAGSRSPIVDVAPRGWDARRRVRACTEAAEAALGFRARTPLGHGLDRTIAWFRAHWDRIEASASDVRSSISLATG